MKKTMIPDALRVTDESIKRRKLSLKKSCRVARGKMGFATRSTRGFRVQFIYKNATASEIIIYPLSRCARGIMHPYARRDGPSDVKNLFKA